MKFSAEAVAQYLELVRDANPIHDEIVPGQMIVQKVLQQYGEQCTSCEVSYKQPVYINETLTVQEAGNSIAVIGDNKVLKVELQRKC